MRTVNDYLDLLDREIMCIVSNIDESIEIDLEIIEDMEDKIRISNILCSIRELNDIRGKLGFCHRIIQEKIVPNIEQV